MIIFSLLSGCVFKLKNKTEQSLKIYKITKKNIFVKKTVLIKKNSNFFKSAHTSGLNTLEINNIIKSIQWQIDFYKLNVGSQFNLVFSYNTLLNTYTLLGVKLNNFGKIYYFIRALNGNFYDLHGLSKKSNFIDFSFLKQYKISSQFNLHRLNPVTHHIAKHLGVDLAMPQGTPILATSNGKVIKACFDKIAGFHITLKDNYRYITKYMHLSKILVKLGDNIKIGQKIALSGNTGRTTGPHLHYEIWINNHAINPVKSKFIFYKELNNKEKQKYIYEAKKILKLLQ